MMWDSVIPLSPYRALSVDRSRIVRHWDDYASLYDSDPVSETDERTWEILMSDGLVPVGSRVLDIGCGTGSLTRRFAIAGTDVLGLDISPVMLDLARSKCSSLTNASFTCQDWLSFNSDNDYDLVFSSFCPAVDDISSIFRMESFSRGRCCLVSLSGPSHDDLILDILRDIGHHGLSFECYDPIYPYSVLKEMGRGPTLRYFPFITESVADTEELIGELIFRISLFQDIDRHTEDVIRNTVNERAVAGVISVKRTRTVSILHWRSPTSTAPW